MLKAIYARDRRAAESKAKEIVTWLKGMKLRTAAELMDQSRRDAHLLRVSLNPLTPGPHE